MAESRSLDPVEQLLAEAASPLLYQVPEVRAEELAEVVAFPTGPRGRGFVVWLTGLSGAGKTTIAEHLAADLTVRGHIVESLDGDVVRTRLSKGLGFSRDDRDENVRRVGWVASRIARVGGAVICALISPYPEPRAEARLLCEQIGANFFEVHVATPLETCIARDPKGLYAQALRGELRQFTGVDDPYVAPERPDLRIDTSDEDVHASVKRILDLLSASGCLRSI